MKKMMRMMLMVTMCFALLSLSACGGGSDNGTQAPAVENSGTEDAQAPAVEESGGADEGASTGAAISADFAKAVDGKLTLKMENAGIIINGTGVALPYAFEELAAAGVKNADDLRSIEVGAGDFFSVNMFLDENEDYLVLPYYYNEGEEAISITEAEASEIGMASYAAEPVDQNVSILGVKFGMTKAEVTDLLGAPSWEDGDYWEWEVAMEDSNYEGYFTIYFNSDADNAVVSQADLDITDYGF